VSYRPPFDFEGLLKFYMTHQVGSLQYVEGGKYCRLVTFHNELGWITVNNNESNSYLEIEIDFPDLSAIQSILTKVRNLFDVDSDPVLITETFKSNRPISQLLSNNPGIRLPSCWEPFEMAIATILGQHVSVTVSNALVNQLINEAGKPIQDTKSGNEINLFPGPDEILRSNLKSVKTTKSRKQAILEFCLAVKEGFISLEATQNADEFRKKIMSIKGLGQWTADYMLLRALRYTDAFPESDLIIKRALEKHPIDIVNQLSPWRGYVATLFWREYA
jgi:AraC family transcriptional regulator of adaptative response / DNA-3-methyladenine glycosylase II